jgi:hypothetical protein
MCFGGIYGACFLVCTPFFGREIPLDVAFTGGPRGIPERRQRKPFSGSWFGGVEPFPVKSFRALLSSKRRKKIEKKVLGVW